MEGSNRSLNSPRAQRAGAPRQGAQRPEVREHANSTQTPRKFRRNQSRNRRLLTRLPHKILMKAWPSVVATPCPASPELCIQARRSAQAPTASALRMSRTYQPSAWPTPPSSSSLAPGALLEEGSLPPDRDLHSGRTCATGTKGVGENLRRSRNIRRAPARRGPSPPP